VRLLQTTFDELAQHPLGALLFTEWRGGNGRHLELPVGDFALVRREPLEGVVDALHPGQPRHFLTRLPLPGSPQFPKSIIH
jgi:hypothetical protein